MEDIETRLSKLENVIRDLFPQKNLVDFVRRFVTEDSYLMCKNVREFLVGDPNDLILTNVYLQDMQNIFPNVLLVRTLNPKLENNETQLHPFVAIEYLKNLGAPGWFMKHAEEWVKNFKDSQIKFLKESMLEMEHRILGMERQLLHGDPGKREDLLCILENSRQTFRADKQKLISLRSACRTGAEPESLAASWDAHWKKGL
jgi:hypothetical protein